MKELLTTGVCTEVLANSYNYSVSMDKCQSLGNMILRKGILNFYLFLDQELKNGL
jgi:hypothetical protein